MLIDVIEAKLAEPKRCQNVSICRWPTESSSPTYRLFPANEINAVWIIATSLQQQPITNTPGKTDTSRPSAVPNVLLATKRWRLAVHLASGWSVLNRSVTM